MQHLPTTIWRVTPAEPPRMLRHCAGCGGERPFATTGKFRINAQSRRLDAWLIYACVDCERTWNLTILTREPVACIPPDLLAKLTANDEATARRFALCPPARAGQWKLERTSAWHVARPPALPDAGCCLCILVAEGCQVRLDRLLAGELGVSREVLRRWLAAGRMVLIGASRGALKKKARNGQLVKLPGAQALPDRDVAKEKQRPLLALKTDLL